MKTTHLIVVLCTLALPTIQPAFAEPDAAKPLEEDRLWGNYASARELLTNNRKPERGDADFAQKLEAWSNAFRGYREAARELFPPLVRMAAEVPEDKFTRVRDDLRHIHQDTQGAMSQAAHDDLKYFCAAILTTVRDKELAKDRADLFIELTAPDEWVREGDECIKQDIPAELTGLAIQDVHALALARGGKFDSAREQSDLLLMKLRKSLKSPLKIGLNHRGSVRSKESVYRECLMHRALIEGLAGDAKAARARVAEAELIEEPDAELQESQAELKKQILERIAE